MKINEVVAPNLKQFNYTQLITALDAMREKAGNRAGAVSAQQVAISPTRLATIDQRIGALAAFTPEQLQAEIESRPEYAQVAQAKQGMGV